MQYEVKYQPETLIEVQLADITSETSLPYDIILMEDNQAKVFCDCFR